MLDTDLAQLYEVETRALLQAVRRNPARFPADFAFQLTAKEFDDLRSQSVIPRLGWGGRRYAPWAFTEQGVAMLSSVLRSDRAAHVNVEIMRAFVRLRRVAENRSCVSRRKQSVGTIELGGPQCSVYLGLLRCRQRSAQPSR
jgi:ORF6N domain-containing protein